jgi:hypothetical protein
MAVNEVLLDKKQEMKRPLYFLIAGILCNMYTMTLCCVLLFI